MSSEQWNLVAAVLGTVAAALTTVGGLMLELNVVSALGIAAGAIGTLGGIAWTISAIQALRRR